MFTEFTAYTDPTGTGYSESLVPVESFDAESSEQAAAILREAGYDVLDVVDTHILVTTH